MKALELTVYPPIPPMPIGKWEIDERRMWWQDRADELDDRDAKRLTDAELAAEYWEHRYGNEVTSGWASDYAIIKQSRERLKTIGRFATLPHYDEAQS